MVLMLSAQQFKRPLEDPDSMSLSPCILPWHTSSLSPAVSVDYHPGPGDVLSPLSPESPTPGGITLYRPSPEPTAPAGEATSPGGTSGLSVGDTTASTSYLKVESHGLSPTALPPPSSLLGGDDDSAINLIFKEEDTTSDDDNNNNVIQSGNNSNNHGKNEHSNDTSCTKQDENANGFDRRVCSTKKTLTTLETLKSPSGVSGSSSAHAQHTQYLQQLGSCSTAYQPISPTFLSNGGISSGMNGFSILQNGSMPNSGGIPNGLCTGYGSGMMNGSSTNGGGGYFSNGYYPVQGVGVGGCVYPGGGGYGASSTNRSCAVASSNMYNSPLGCSTSSSLQPCDLSITSCSLTSSPPSLSPMPPSLSPISPSSFSSSSCMYSAWRSGGLTAVAAAASGITGAVTPPPAANTNTHTHSYLHPPAHHNGYTSVGGGCGGGGQGGILTAHHHSQLPPTYSTGLTSSSSLGGTLTDHHPSGGTFNYSAPTLSPTPTVTPTVSLHSSASEHRHSFFIKGKTFFISIPEL